VSDRELHTYYKNCDVFLLLSHHEGFCVPIIESQSHSLPIVGLDRTASAETMGPDQLTFETEDPNEIATALHVVATHGDVRNFLKERGLANCKKYSEENVQKCYADLLFNKL
jgi:glycosyltransferase involved in cell wall biosynthesis